MSHVTFHFWEESQVFAAVCLETVLVRWFGSGGRISDWMSVVKSEISSSSELCASSLLPHQRPGQLPEPQTTWSQIRGHTHWQSSSPEPRQKSPAWPEAIQTIRSEIQPPTWMYILYSTTGHSSKENREKTEIKAQNSHPTKTSTEISA